MSTSPIATSRWPSVLLAAAALLVGLPIAAGAISADSTREVLGRLLALLLYGWITYRLFLQLRSGSDREPTFWYVSALGHVVVLGLGAALVVWDSSVGAFTPRSLVLPGVSAALVVTHLLVARRVD